MSTHEFEMNIDGEIIRWAEKSHAQIFRNFWQFFMEKDLQKTIETIEFTGIRTSDSEYSKTLKVLFLPFAVPHAFPPVPC
ncbi:hypothetical protein AB1K18_10490 [Peribacillus simplex]|uniref:hypothetical protein n=1 Tax=Peribacillus simplex TaxID=1478 RepID=UPI003B8BA3B6